VSYYWTPTCATCGEDGPKIRSAHFGLKFGPDHATSSEVLKQWLDQHEYHDVRLRGEGLPAADDRSPIRLIGHGPVVLSLGTPVAPGTRQVIGNRGDKPIVLRENEGTASPQNRFVFPAGVSEVVVPPHAAATFVAEKPSRRQRLWCWLTRRVPELRWRYQPWDQKQETTKEVKR
jgi:hypothetical protein